MKKNIALLIALVSVNIVYGQYYYIPFINAGHNPGSLNMEYEYPVGGGLAADWTIVLGPSNATPAWSSVFTLPFTFNFNGIPVSSYMVSSSGVLTFTTSYSGAAPPYINQTLPDASIPDNSICVWGIAGTGTNDNIVTKTFGTSPNRQYWISFSSYTGEVGTAGWQYWSIVLEESTNNIYLVDQRCSGNIPTLTLGIQLNTASAYSVAGSPDVGSYTMNDPSPLDNSYYKLLHGFQLNYDLYLKSLDLSQILPLNSAPFLVAGELINLGAETITSYDLNYSVNSGTIITSSITGVNLLPFDTLSFGHPQPWSPSTTGIYTLKTWASNINGNTDQNPANDTLSMQLTILSDYTQRMPLHEVFTSSTCGFCLQGNQNLESIFANNTDHWTCLKYQMSWPSPGDPYYTDEGGDRHDFYSVTGVPDLYVDGGVGINPINYTQTQLDDAYSQPAYIALQANCQIIGHTVNIHSDIIPLLDFSSPDIKIFVAIFEYVTNNNVGTNGQTTFYHVMKKILPDANGVNIAPLMAYEPVSMDFSYAFQGNYRLPSGSQNPINNAIEHSVEEFSDLGAVIWLQNTLTKEVLQSCFATVSYTPVLNDLGVTALLSPLSGNNLPDSATVIARIKNFGADPQSNFTVTYILDGGAPVTQLVTTSLGSEDSLDISFTIPADVSAPGIHQFLAYTSLIGDVNPSNDTLYTSISNDVNGPCGTLTVLYESFEGPVFPPECWTKYNPDGGTGWYQETVGVTPLNGWNGGVVTPTPDGLGGNKMAYCTWNTGGASSSDQWLVTPQLAIGLDYSLSFYVRKFGSYFDLMDIRISTTDNQMASFNNLLATLSWSASDSGWSFEIFNLSAYAGQNIYLAFQEHVADNYNDGAAIFIDMVKVEGPQANNLIYDNGSIVNSPGTGAGGADESILQASLGMSTYGAGHALSTGFRIADDFVVPEGNTWYVTAASFDAYQTGSGTTSTINHVNFRIWNGSPGIGSIVFGDELTNRLSGTSFTNIYRINEGNTGNTERPVMRDECGLGLLVLSPGTYWIDWQTGGTGASGPWIPPITITGQTTTGNAQQFNPSTLGWSEYNDSGTGTPQGMPFKLYGYIQADTDFLTLDPLYSFVPYDAGYVDINVTSNVNWTVSENEPWLSVQPAGGINNGTFTIFYDQNTGAQRTAEITVSVPGSNLLQIFTLIQEAGNIIITTIPSITVCAGPFELPVLVQNFSNVAAISLILKYDDSYISYDTFCCQNSALNNGILIVNGTGNGVAIGWFSISPINISDGELIRLSFNSLGTYQTLPTMLAFEWDNQPGNCQYQDIYNQIIPSSFLNNSIVVGFCAELNGSLTYDNSLHTPLNNANVSIYQNNMLYSETQADASGSYLFAFLPPGNFSLGAQCTKPWGGSNAGDALQVLRHFAGQITLSPFRLLAADVDASNYINAADALMVAKRFVNMIFSFPAGDWLFEHPTVTLPQTGSITQDFKGLCFGDVDGTYIPPAKQQPEIILLPYEVMSENTENIDIPVYALQDFSTAALSLVLKYPADRIEILDVSSPLEGTLVYLADNSVLRLAWYSLVPADLSRGTAFLHLKVHLTDKASTISADNFTIGEGSQFADFDARVIPQVMMGIPNIYPCSLPATLGQNIPNPFSETTTIPFYIPVEAKVRLTVGDLLGRELMVLVDDMLPTGNHQADISSKTLNPGIYLYTLEVSVNNTRQVLLERMVVQ